MAKLCAGSYVSIAIQVMGQIHDDRWLVELGVSTGIQCDEAEALPAWLQFEYDVLERAWRFNLELASARLAVSIK